MPMVDIGDLRIHFEDVGDGEPLLLLHGGMASGEYWRRAGHVDALAGHHRLIIPDFRGHGRSTRTRDQARYGLRHDVADMVAVLDAAGVRAVTACGWSWGGTVALALAATRPERISAVLTTGTFGHHGFADVPADYSGFAQMADTIATGGMRPLAGRLTAMGGADWLHDLMLDNDPAAMIAWYRGQPAAAPAGCALSDIEQPVLLAAGEDELERVSFPDPLRPAHARTHVVRGANHVSAFLRTDVLTAALAGLVAGGARGGRTGAETDG